MPPAPGALGKSSEDALSAGTTGDHVSGYDAIAVVRVVARQHPIAVAAAQGGPAARPSGKYGPPGPGPWDFDVVRPATLQVVRQIKGTVGGPCLSLDIPGGNTSSRVVHESEFPARFGVGDTMLGFFMKERPSATTAAIATLLLTADGQGTVRIPFAGLEQVNVYTWAPPAPSPPGPPPPAGTMSSPPAAAAGPPPTTRSR